MSDSVKPPSRTLIVMGVSGCGKSLIGAMLAKALGGVFDDGDDFHPPANKAKMSQKIPLTDEDRWPWLANLRERILEMRPKIAWHVVACSALKRKYRDLLRGDDTTEQLQFVYMRGSKELIASRLNARKGHFFKPELLDSQFAALEEPEAGEAIVVDISGTPEEIVQEVLRVLGQEQAAASN
ncbi:gluconate kinase (SKI family) [Roseimicrobium gellanilyticum]|uniref:Gluconokinase n=1 Tax=Roseimicrobium gellanilyticum TaxID=748857 RepID=A0A366HTU6_9BACT|nr:gluconokinase [Roseimicrobium gellanilyticum]RBP46353.1 gluconate kinase (SKI family) [Roseimicrobium gellanilyticum]